MSLIPAVAAVIAFILTENMRNVMVIVDRFTWMMALIALAQVVVCVLAHKEREEAEDSRRTRA